MFTPGVDGDVQTGPVNGAVEGGVVSVWGHPIYSHSLCYGNVAVKDSVGGGPHHHQG